MWPRPGRFLPVTGHALPGCSSNVKILYDVNTKGLIQLFCQYFMYTVHSVASYKEK